ncbi:MAG TPA: 16S rRNA (guanine(527)-N(7))-methyltransferase RsmG [Solirubrobacterales bacterium]|nr:16S rRNA (guanine(527)-N(7))-methyltransferase RsmG [Solirubrobacterales bacterium]
MSRGPAEALDAAAREKLGTVLALLAEERASVSSVVDERAWQVHVLDSLTGLEVPDLLAARRIADVGAGAGFPGLVLAVALPEAQVDLVESVGRKCEFMRRAAEAAGIANAAVRNARSEELAAGGGREAYDAVTARAVGRLSTLAELASPLLKPNGVLVAWKGRRDAEEERQLERASGALAMEPEAILDVGSRAGSRHRHLHVIRKTGPTPINLPRKPGIAKKRPKGG